MGGERVGGGGESFAEGLVGIVLDGRYRLDAVLGEGGMGAVFRAWHLAMERKVAVKLLKPHLAQDDAALERFTREARATMRVDSPHAVKVLDFGITPQRDYYMALEYLDGRTVQRELDVDGPFAPARALHIGEQVAIALAAAHAVGLVHRDVKPDNVLLMRAGGDPDFAKVLDFGVAKLMEGAARSTRSQLSITQAGMVFGTPEFMSPEQACGQALDGRSDVYSLAATLFAMLTGRGMYPATTPLEWLTAHASKPPPHLADGLPELAPLGALDALLQQCLAKHASQRPPTAQAFADRLAALARGETSVPEIATTTPPKVGERIRPAFSPSTFIPALELVPPELRGPPREPVEPVEPFGATAPSVAVAPAPRAITSADVEPPRRSRGMWLAVGGIGVAGVIAAAIAIAATHGHPARAPSTVPPVDATIAAVVPAPPVDAAPAPVDAAPPSPIDAGIAPVPHISHTAAAVAGYLAEAEAAKQSGNTLRWINRADLAHRLDPSNARATLLLGEGLIASGDLEHGCKYLRELGRNPTAAQLVQASCGRD